MSETSDRSLQKAIERDLREREEQLRVIFETSQAGIILVNPQGEITFANQRMADMFGCTLDDLIGTSYLEHLHSDEKLIGDERMRKLIAGDVDHVYTERRYLKNDGSAFWGYLSGRRHEDDDGNLISLVGVIADISERKQAECEIEELNNALTVRAQELEVANLELDAFNATVSHDLRNPMAIIKGFCQLILEKHADEVSSQCREFVQIIASEIQRMDRLVISLLSFAKSSSQELNRTNVNLSDMVSQIAHNLQIRFPERQAVFRIAPGVCCDGDSDLIRVVMENLIGNAWKYTGKKEMALIEFGTAEKEGFKVFYVRDNGVGFNKDQAGRIFTVFQRLHSDQEFEGIGIGLATVERIIARHGGRIWVDGEIGKGATFNFCLTRS